jgi:hypothetical protein
LPGALARASRQVNIDKGGLIGSFGVTISRRQHEGFHQQQNGLHPRYGQQGVKKTDFRTAGVGKREVNPLGIELVYEEFAPSAYDLLTFILFILICAW